MMPKKLDPVIADILKSFGFGPDACWDCHGTWVVYHKVLEQIAAKANIAFEPPQVIEARSADGIVAVCVTGRRESKSEWSFGEAAPKNNKTAYPYAMAEKRAKDRVILKLIGLHGLAYSEEEADDFKAPPAAPERGEPADNPSLDIKAVVADLVQTIERAPSLGMLNSLKRQGTDFEVAYGSVPESERSPIKAAWSKRRLELSKSELQMAG